MPTSLLLHFNGANASTTFTDSSSNALSVTGGGNAQLSTAQQKFGTASALFDGTGDSLQLPSSSALDFGTEPFTVEFWMRTNGTQDPFSLLVSRNANAPSTGGANVFGIGNGTSAGTLGASINATEITTSNATVNDGNWHHVAVSRSGTNMWLGVDGAIVASSSSVPVGDTTTLSSGRIGRWQGNDFSDNNYNGYLDEFRVTKGEALYTATYTVPTAEFRFVEFSSPEGALETLFVTDYAMIDQYAATGSLWNWGRQALNATQLGDNTTTPKSSPIQTVSGGTNWKSVAGGGNHTAAIKTDGTLWLWGANTDGRLGNNAVTHRASPVQTVSGGTNWKHVANFASNHTAAIKTDGTLWLWGLNTNGRLGDNSITHRSSPVQTVAGGTNWKLVAGGGYHTASIKTDGRLWLWGRNSSGQLGDNSITDKSSPVQTVAGGTNWKLVAGGESHTASIKIDGRLWLWGLNTNGQLGDNSITHRSSPVQTVAGGTNWKSVAGGNFHTTCIKTDGTLWLWGFNHAGQLGDNSITHRSSPVQTVAGGTNWKQVACGRFHTAAIKTDGTLWTWGNNPDGNLGTNNITNISSPVQTVAGGTNWKLVAGGGLHTAAIFFYEADKLYPPS